MIADSVSSFDAGVGGSFGVASALALALLAFSSSLASSSSFKYAAVIGSGY